LDTWAFNEGGYLQVLGRGVVLQHPYVRVEPFEVDVEYLLMVSHDGDKLL
jgi:hypothetical protein